MKPFIVLGDSGFIGSAFLKQLRYQNETVIGINRHRISIFEDQTLREVPRSSSDLSVEILPFLEDGAVLINTVWGKNDRGNRDSTIHIEYAMAEMLLIDVLKDSGCHYISFGSIAEIDDELISPSRKTEYAEAKKLVADYLAKSGLMFNWLRAASLYGPGDRRAWLLTNLLQNFQTGEEVVLQNPTQEINLCHIDSLIAATLFLIENSILGDLNITTDQWVTVSGLKKSFMELTEPNYSKRLSGSFSHSDPKVLIVASPPLLDFLKSARKITNLE